jgi:hypothetical protein
MLGERQDPLVGLLVQRKMDRGERAILCPACARSMIRVRAIWRAFADDLQVFECRACNVSVSAKLSPA